VAIFKKKDSVESIMNDDISVYTKNSKRKYDSVFRDVYGERQEKTNETGPESRAFVYVGTAIVAPASMTGSYLLGGAVKTVFEVVMFMSKGNPFPSNIPFKAFSFTTFQHWWHLEILGAGLVTLGAYAALNAMWRNRNSDNDNSDILTHKNDGHVVHPLELAAKFDIIPDAGMHFEGNVTAILAHMPLSKKGLPNVKMYKRYEEDTTVLVDTGVLDENGETIFTEEKYLKGERVVDKNGEYVLESKPMIDEAFMDRLWTSSYIPEGKVGKLLRQRYKASDLLYNPRGAFGKPKYHTVKEAIENLWEMPPWEIQRPGGGYIVDKSPSNTMLLAMSRGGKGQTVIEPTIDAWLRQKDKWNLLANDPKGELLVKFYVPATKRGFEVVQFNLMNPSKTNIFNSLGYAVDAARSGNTQGLMTLIENMGDVFFPADGKGEVFWPKAASAAFQRSALVMIDYYMEEEDELKEKALLERWSSEQLEQRLDEMWGYVTPYNVYQMMITLASKKSSDAEFIKIREDENVEEKDLLTLLMDATKELPRNALRNAVVDKDSVLRSMAGSDKTISSVYGIALTAMSFFADNTIKRFTSGRPSQNFDMVGLAFPRRFGVRFDSEYIAKNGLKGQNAVWTFYRNIQPGSGQFVDQYEGEDFIHEGLIDSFGWARGYFKGIFEEPVTYVKLEIVSNKNNMTIDTFYFKFTKGYQKDMSGRTFVIDTVTGSRIVLNGALTEFVRSKGNKKGANRQLTPGRRMRRSDVLDWTNTEFTNKNKGRYKTRIKEFPTITQMDVHYTERPKAMFLVTPPHLMSYAKIVLVLVNQMFNMSVADSYMVKKDQKPLYGTNYMLDEVGNLQSDGVGIPHIDTKESIGLGQKQQFTLVLQTLAQLQEVYGASIDKILQGNTGNIVYLRSTDISMLDVLEKQSGIKHVARKSGKNITKRMDAVMKSNANDKSISVSVGTVEEPVISKQDMLMIQPANAMVFGKGNPIWATNQLALPYAHELHKNQLRMSELDSFSLATVPSNYNTDDFDVQRNIPDFERMVTRRVSQAKIMVGNDDRPGILEMYRKAHDLETDADIRRLDPEVLASEMMQGIRTVYEYMGLERVANIDAKMKVMEENGATQEEIDRALMNEAEKANEEIEKEETKKFKDNTDEVYNKSNERERGEYHDWNDRKFAGGLISKADLNHRGGSVGPLDYQIATAYEGSISAFKRSNEFRVDDTNSLFLGNTPLIVSTKRELSKLEGDSTGDLINVDGKFNKNDVDANAKYHVLPSFYQYLIQQKDWGFVEGYFEREFISAYNNR
jgi:type IV secretory pathway TraG/TraD family ATPase VirD4